MMNCENEKKQQAKTMNKRNWTRQDKKDEDTKMEEEISMKVEAWR